MKNRFLFWSNGEITAYDKSEVKSVKAKSVYWTVVHNDDSETQYRYYNVDSITFSISPWLFKVSSAKVTDITDTSAKVEFNVWLNVEKAPYRVWPLEGVCFSEHNEIPTTDDLIMSTCGFSADDSCYVEKLEGLTPGTTYYLRPYVSLYLEPVYGEACSFTTTGEKPTDPNTYVTIDGHEFVDLRLPSGVKWATCNVGASRPEGYGDLFAWGETKTKDSFTADNYKWKDNNKYGTKKTVLDAEDDAATQNWGKNYRMPTRKEITELYNNCTWEATIINSVAGYKVTGRNGSYIFLPFADAKLDGRVERHWGIRFFLWASSHHETDSRYSFYLCGSNDSKFIAAEEPYKGFSVRAVAK